MSTYPATSSMACTYFSGSTDMYSSSYSYFKIDCGGSPSLTFYSDAGCTAMGSTISQGTCETGLSASYAYQFSCAGSASTAASPSPPPPSGSSSSDAALKAYSDASCTGSALTTTLAPSQQCTPITISGNSMYFKLLCSDPSPYVQFYTDSSCTSLGSYSSFSQSACQGQDSLGGSPGTYYSFTCPSSYVSWHPNAGLPRTLLS
jgi:hypothetical protein